MEFGNETRDKGFFIKIFIALIVLALLIGGYFYISKTDAPLVTENNQSVPLPKGFERDMENKIPELFPNGLIFEKDVQVIESFNQVTKTTQEATYRYISKLNFVDSYKLYTRYLVKNGYVNKLGNVDDQYSYGVFEKPGIKILISSSYMKEYNANVVTITIVKEVI